MSAVLAGNPDKSLVLVAGRSHPKLASDVAAQLGIDVLETTAYDFANGEIYVRYTESVRGSDVFVLQTSTSPTNKNIMEQLIMIDALKRASARSVTAVCPLMPYCRQDKKHLGREPISSRLMCDLLKTAGANRIVSVDLHASQSQGFFDGPVDHLAAMPVLIDYVRAKMDLDNISVVSPDAGRIRVAEQWAHRLGGGPLAFVHKTHDITRANHVTSNRVVGDVEGKDCVLVDDLIDTGGTIAGACRVLKDSGAKSVTIVATHGVFSEPCIERLKNCGAREVIVTDTVPISEEKRWDGLTVLSIAPLHADAIKAVFANGSMADLFETYPANHKEQGIVYA